MITPPASQEPGPVRNGTGGGVAAALTAVMVAAALVRVIWFWSLAASPDFRSPVLDPQLNDYWARALVTGDWTPPAGAEDPEIRAHSYGRPPGYPWFLAAVYRVFGISPTAPRMAQACLGLVNVMLLFLLGRAMFGAGAGLAAALIGALYWGWVHAEGELNSPVLEVLLYLLLAGALWRWARSPRWGWALAAGALLGLHALIRPNVLLTGLFAAAWMVWAGTAAGRRRAAGQAAAMAAAMFLCVSPAVLRNGLVSGEFALVSHYGGINAYIGNHPGGTGDSARLAGLREIAGRDGWNCFDYPLLVRGLAERQGWEHPSFSRASRWFYGKALQFWLEEPLAAARLTLRKALLFWGPAEVSDSRVIAVEREHSPLLRRLPGFGVVLALALLRPLLALGRRTGKAAGPRPGPLLLALVAGHFFAVLPFFIAGRYRLPVVAFLALCGGASAALALDWLRSAGQRKRAFAALAAFAVLLAGHQLIAAAPLAAYQPSRADWHYHRGIALADSGRDRLAEFEAAVAAEPGHDRAWLRLGFEQARRGNHPAALAAYGHAAAANPQNAQARNNLGYELYLAGRFEEAEREYSVALELQPGYVTALNNLGNLLLDRGRAGEALDCYHKVLELEPGNRTALCNSCKALEYMGLSAEAAECLRRCEAQS